MSFNLSQVVLLNAFKKFLANSYRDVGRLKRGGHFQFVSLEELQSESANALEDNWVREHENTFDREWAAIDVSTALENLEKEMALEGAEKRYVILKPMLNLQLN